MNILFDSEKLRQLLNSLYMFTGIQMGIYDKTGKDTNIFGRHTDFCRIINQSPEGHRRCEHCDELAVKTCMELRNHYSYRCHAGLCETIIPIFSNSEPMAFLSFGQILDDSPYRTQWENTLATLSWYQGDILELRECFFRLERMSREKQRAFEDILEAVALYIPLEGIIMTTDLSDQQRLEMYINEHYTEKLSLARISHDLNMGSTKLCSLAKKLTGEGSITKMVSARRIAEAKTLLVNENLTITQIAERVGFSDYNYFTNVFRKTTGVTPTAYRKMVTNNMHIFDGADKKR